MPKYGTTNPCSFLGLGYPTNQAVVFNAETIVINEYSERVHIPLGPTAGARAIRVEVDFSADPGNFEIDVLESDLDTSAAYYQNVPSGGALTQANKTTGPNGANTRIATDLIPFAGQFCSLFVKTAPSNAVTATARITRAS